MMRAGGGGWRVAGSEWHATPTPTIARHPPIAQRTTSGTRETI
jgi:hypothetical protein